METDLGLALIRFALGAMLIAHGLNKATGPDGFTGTTKWFEALGLQPAWLHARLAAFIEVGAGALLLVGLFTGVAAAAFIGLMTVAALTDHRGKGFFVFKGGWEYTALVGIAALALAFSGPGDWSLDALLGLDVGGTATGLLSGAIGVGAGLALIAVCRRPSRVPRNT